MNTKTLPPIEILGLLHKCEEMGIDLPREIDKWWERETIAQQEEQERKLRIQKELRKSAGHLWLSK